MNIENCKNFVLIYRLNILKQQSLFIQKVDQFITEFVYSEVDQFITEFIYSEVDLLIY